MAKEYLERLTALMHEIASTGFDDVAFDCRHFFSGAAVYVDGRICLTLTPVGLALKLPEESRRELLNDHGAQALRYFPDAPIKKDYVVLPESMLSDIDALRRWISEGINYARSLP